MVIIAELVKDINCFIDKAECYIDKAIEWKDEYAEISEEYFKIYEGCMANVDSLHTFVVNLIKEKKDNEITDKTTLDVMTNVWKFTHSEILNRIDHIQYKVDKYKVM